MASAADSAHAYACVSPRRFPEAGKTAPASTIQQPAQRRSGHASTLIVVVPTEGKPALRFAGHVDG
jgi:hypothetical protein